jgi:hypothetical protein
MCAKSSMLAMCLNVVRGHRIWTQMLDEIRNKKIEKDAYD